VHDRTFGPTLAAPGTYVPPSGRNDPNAKSRAGSRSMKFGSTPDAFGVGGSRSAVVLSLRILNKRGPRGAEPTTGKCYKYRWAQSEQRLHSTVGPKIS